MTAWNFRFGEYARLFVRAILHLLHLIGARFGRRSTPQSAYVQLLGLISLVDDREDVTGDERELRPKRKREDRL
jgi:hypothetical protein